MVSTSDIGVIAQEAVAACYSEFSETSERDFCAQYVNYCAFQAAEEVSEFILCSKSGHCEETRTTQACANMAPFMTSEYGEAGEYRSTKKPDESTIPTESASAKPAATPARPAARSGDSSPYPRIDVDKLYSDGMMSAIQARAEELALRILPAQIFRHGSTQVCHYYREDDVLMGRDAFCDSLEQSASVMVQHYGARLAVNDWFRDRHSEIGAMATGSGEKASCYRDRIAPYDSRLPITAEVGFGVTYSFNTRAQCHAIEDAYDQAGVAIREIERRASIDLVKQRQEIAKAFRSVTPDENGTMNVLSLDKDMFRDYLHTVERIAANTRSTAEDVIGTVIHTIRTTCADSEFAEGNPKLCDGSMTSIIGGAYAYYQIFEDRWQIIERVLKTGISYDTSAFDAEWEKARQAARSEHGTRWGLFTQTQKGVSILKQLGIMYPKK